MQNKSLQTNFLLSNLTNQDGCSVKNIGFTLAELVVTLVIISLLTAIAIPSFQSYARELETKRTLEILQPVFSQARTVSLTERVDVVLCPTQDFSSCNKANPRGIISFKDINQNQRHDTGELMLGATSLKLKYGFINFNNGTNTDYVRFFSDSGEPRGRPGNVTYCPNNGDAKFAKSLIFNRHGRARLSFDHNGDGVDDRRSRNSPISSNCNR